MLILPFASMAQSPLDAEFLRDRSRHLPAARFGNDGFQHVDLEQPGLSRHRSATGAPCRVRVRMANLTMTNHPIHLHGHRVAVSCTDGGWVPETAQWPETTVDVPVGAIRAFEFVADNPGDSAFHCHKTHHAMNAMGHNTKNF